MLFFWPDFYISFIWDLSRLGGRRGILVSLFISILTTTARRAHFGYFDRNTESHTLFVQKCFSNYHGYVDDDDGNDNVCSPMFTNDYPLCLLASQSYAAIQHDDNDKDGANSNDLKISSINYNVNPLE